MILIKIAIFLWFLLIYIRNIFPEKTNTLFFKLFPKNILLFDFLVPIWSVFTPLPINSDLKIFYRDLYTSGKESELNEIKFYNSKSNFLVYEYQRERKFIYTFYRLLTAHQNKDILLQTSEYISFKLFISKKNYSEKIKTRQVIIIRTFGYISNKKEIVELIDYINYV